MVKNKLLSEQSPVPQKIFNNMNKLFLTLFVIFVTLSLNSRVFAQTTSPTPEVSADEKLIDEINNLREKVASKVAELNLVEKRGIIITVNDVSGNKITGNDLMNNIRNVDVDELTKFSSPSAKSFGISDINKGSKLSVIGLYNKQSKRILARFIKTVNTPIFISGVITEVDKANFTLTVLDEKNTSTIVDIETVTKTSIYTQEDGTVKYGFSKLESGDRVYLVGFSDAKEKNRITATRVLVLPELAINPKIEFSDEVSSLDDEQATTSAN